MGRNFVGDLSLPSLMQAGKGAEAEPVQRRSDGPLESLPPTHGPLEWTEGALGLLRRHCGLWAPQGFFRALWWFRWGRLTIRRDNRRQGA